MLNIKMDFKKGVFFIRLEGDLNNKTIRLFETIVFPIVLRQGFKKVVINFDKLLTIDKKGVNLLIKLNSYLSKNYGRLSLCNLTNVDVRNIIDNEYKDEFNITDNELSALEAI